MFLLMFLATYFPDVGKCVVCVQNRSAVFPQVALLLLVRDTRAWKLYSKKLHLRCYPEHLELFASKSNVSFG